MPPLPLPDEGEEDGGPFGYGRALGPDYPGELAEGSRWLPPDDASETGPEGVCLPPDKESSEYGRDLSPREWSDRLAVEFEGDAAPGAVGGEGVGIASCPGGCEAV